MAEPAATLVTCALPYANGPLHIGHLVGYIQADIWVRSQRMLGREVRFVCADDAHGTPIMLAAEQAGTTPEAFVTEIRLGHEQDFADFHVDFDFYHSTHSEENRQLVMEVYGRLRDGGHIVKRQVEQFFDPQRELFLPDRYVKGGCPRCGAKDQYGDNCEVCGATYAPTDLVEPYSVVSGAAPVRKSSEHYFFDLSQFADFLDQWTRRDGVAHPGVIAKLREWLDSGLKAWDISRDAPYFGFAIPDAPGKYFYVWLDAPIGYMAAFKAWCDAHNQPEAFARFWRPGHDTALVHFIGKDIVNFHGLFWPAMLHGAGFRVPDELRVNGYLTVNGAKMSKSRGTFITARSVLDHGIEPDYLRYYFAAKSSGGIEDLDLNLDDFVARVNSDLIGKWVNIASRTARFVATLGAGRLGTSLPEPELYAQLTAARAEIERDYRAGRLNQTLTRIMALADLTNEYIARQAPWALAKDPARAAEAVAVATQALNCFRVLTLYLAPVIPELAARAARFLGVPGDRLDAIDSPLLDVAINDYTHLAKRIEAAQIDALLVSNRATLIDASASAPSSAPVAPPAPTVAAAQVTKANAAALTIDEFNRVELRIARIVAAEQVADADKLLKLTVDLGGEQRQLFAGIKGAYDPAQLIGRLTVVVANLAPRKMRFGLSEGMLLAASDERGGPFLLAPDSGAEPGMRVK